MLALCCDYRVMTDGEKRNAWMCMNEVRALLIRGSCRCPERPGRVQIHLGSPWPLSFVSALRVKVGDANLHRKIALEGYRFTPKEALAVGLVDHIAPGNSAEAVLRKARELAESVDSLAKGGAWGLIKVDTSFRDNSRPATDKHFRRRTCIEMLSTHSNYRAERRRIQRRQPLRRGLGCDGGSRPAINAFSSRRDSNVCSFEVFGVYLR